MPAVACLNEYLVRLDGSSVEMNMTGGGRPFGYDNEDFYRNTKENVRSRFAAYQSSKNLEDYSDYGVALVRDQQYIAAKKIFLEIEKQKPGLYATSANLGTTYELLGKNDSALYWIRKAVAINPHSHQGSEWIHVKILEAKNNASIKDLYHYNILSLNFGNNDTPENLNGPRVNLDSLYYQLDYQMEERVFFVKPKDAVMGQLLFQLGNVIAMKGTLREAVDIYKKAAEYGYTDELMDARIKLFNNLQEDSDDRRDGLIYFKLIIYLIIAIPIAIGIFWFIYNRRKKN